MLNKHRYPFALEHNNNSFDFSQLFNSQQNSLFFLSNSFSSLFVQNQKFHFEYSNHKVYREIRFQNKVC